MTTTEKQIIIAKWLGWEEFVSNWFNHPKESKKYCSRELKFDSNSEWQWLCLEKIAKKLNTDIVSVMVILEKYVNKDIRDQTIKTKNDLFEAIFQYVNKNKPVNLPFKPL